MKTLLAALLAAPLAVLAAEGYRLDRSPHDSRDLVSLQLGPDVMVATQASLEGELPSSEMVRQINTVEEALRVAFPDVRWSFFEPDDST